MNPRTSVQPSTACGATSRLASKHRLGRAGVDRRFRTCRTVPGDAARGSSVSARAVWPGAKLHRMTSERVTLEFRRSPIVRQLDEVAARVKVSRRELVERALAVYLPTVTEPEPMPVGSFPALPVGYHGGALKVYTGLAELGGGPVKSVEIAEFIGIHRGNVDRHLARLRSDGFVRRDGAGRHVIVLAEQKQLFVKAGSTDAG